MRSGKHARRHMLHRAVTESVKRATSGQTTGVVLAIRSSLRRDLAHSGLLTEEGKRGIHLPGDSPDHGFGDGSGGRGTGCIQRSGFRAAFGSAIEHSRRALPSQRPTAAPQPSTTTSPSTPSPVSPTPIAGSNIVAIGDSVMLGAAPALIERLPGIDIHAKVGLQPWDARNVAVDLAQHGQLRKIVILGAGTNGYLDMATVASIRRIIGPDRFLVLVNAYADSTDHRDTGTGGGLRTHGRQGHRHLGVPQGVRHVGEPRQRPAGPRHAH